MRKTAILSAVFALALGVFAASAQAETITFSRYTTNASTDIASQLTVDLSFSSTGSGSSTVTTAHFRWFNNVGTSSSIASLYFNEIWFDQVGGASVTGGLDLLADPGSAGGGWNPTITDSDIGTATGVVFAPPGSPATPPGMNSLGWTTGYGAAASPPSEGVNLSTEWVETSIVLLSGVTQQDVLDALGNQSSASNSLLAMHVTGIGSTSDTFYSDGLVPVPEPASVVLLAVGLGGLLYVRRRRLQIVSR